PEKYAVAVPEPARYDGHADWYDETFSAFPAAEDAEFLQMALPAGGGAAGLDVACGTGRHGEAIAAAGFTPLGFDLSADQLRVARARGSLGSFVRADAR